jgi:hypothetical protein
VLDEPLAPGRADPRRGAAPHVGERAADRPAEHLAHGRAGRAFGSPQPGEDGLDAAEHAPRILDEARFEQVVEGEDGGQPGGRQPQVGRAGGGVRAGHEVGELRAGEGRLGPRTFEEAVPGGPVQRVTLHLVGVR